MMTLEELFAKMPSFGYKVLDTVIKDCFTTIATSDDLDEIKCATDIVHFIVRKSGLPATTSVHMLMLLVPMNPNSKMLNEKVVNEKFVAN